MSPLIRVDSVGTVERAQVGGDKALGEVQDAPLTPQIEGPALDDMPGPDGAEDTVAGPFDQPDCDAVAWGKAVE